MDTLLIIRTIQNLSYSGKSISVSDKGIELCVNDKSKIHYFFPNKEIQSVFWNGKKLQFEDFYDLFITKGE